MKLSDLKKYDVIEYIFIDETTPSSIIFGWVTEVEKDKIWLCDLASVDKNQMLDQDWYVEPNSKNLKILRHFGNADPSNLLPEEVKFLLNT